MDANSPWKPLAKVPIESFTSIIKINECEFIIAPYNSIAKDSTFEDTILQMYKYNINDNKWEIFMYDINEHTSRGIFGIKSNNNELYVCQPQSSTHETAELSIINIKTTQIMETYETKLNFGTNPTSLMIDDKFHVISGSCNDYHYVWNDKTHKFDRVGYNKHWQGLQCVQFEYIPSQNILLSFGGYSRSYAISKTFLDNINWETLDLKLPIAMSQIGTILTMDNKWLIMFGGGFSNSSNMIYGLDLQEWKFYKSKIKMPFTGSSSTLLMDNTRNNDLIINGYLRINDINIPYHDIVDLLLQWYSVSEIYIIRDGDGSQWKIELNDIIDTLHPIVDGL